MESRIFCFQATLGGQRKDLIVEAPVENDMVITNQFCPDVLLTGGNSSVCPMNGESAVDFIFDCRRQINGMQIVDVATAKFDLHIAGLMTSVNDHITSCGRLIFSDLLIYMDCFSLLLEADGFPRHEILNSYPHIIRCIVDLYPDYIFSSEDLSPFRGSRCEKVLSWVCESKK